MKSSILLTGTTLQTGIIRNSTKLLSGIFLFFVLLLAGAVSAQTVGTSNLSCDISNRNPCTSKDLEIVSVAIDAPPCTSCTLGQPTTLPLKMTIHNGTKSERTSFALYGTLSSGASINGSSGNIFVCVGPITVKSDETLPGESAPGNQTFAVGTITFTCGQDLTLSNNFLAWTDASGTTADRCNTFSQATKCADIAPKCGTASSITIIGPVIPPTLGKVDPTCTVSTGKVTVTSSTTGLTFSLDGGAFTAYPTGGWTVSSGQHCVRSKRTSDGCISNQTCITIPAQPANPDRPVMTLQEATICGTLTAPTCTVSCPIAGTYTLTQTGVSGSQTKTYPTDNPVVFTVQAGKQFSMTVTTTAGCTSAATNCTNYTTNSCPGSVVAKPDNTLVQDITLQKKSHPTVNAAPNPFNDRIRFILKSEVSGQGSLDLYNILGQRVTTVFRGQVSASQVQTIDYAVPVAQRAGLIYTFRVGKEETSGKLIGLKK
jgi:hypothetical protein